MDAIVEKGHPPGPLTTSATTPLPASPGSTQDLHTKSGACLEETHAAPVASGTPSTSEADIDLITKGLRFLSTATPETLGGIGVGLAAVTYVVLGKLGLVLIGAFGGVVLFVSYEARHPEISRVVHGERGTDVLTRLGLDKVRELPSKEDKEIEEQRAIAAFDDFGPETREALGGFVDAVIRDYVKWWYSPILPGDAAFPLACRKNLNSFILSISNALYRKRPADSFLDLLTNTSSIFIVFLSELSAAYADVPAESNLTAPDAIYNYLAENPDSRLASLLSQPQQAAKFRMAAEDLLQFLDKSTQSCDPARVFLREILAGVILEMSLQTCSKPEWINGWIVYLLEAGEPDFSQAIDVGMQTGPDTSNQNAFFDIDGNVGNISLAKPSRGSFEQDRYRRKEPVLAHKKKLSKADEEMETAMEEMKRMNAMLKGTDDQKMKDSWSSPDRHERSGQSISQDSIETDTQKTVSTSGDMSPRSQSSLEKGRADESAQSETLHSPITPRSTTDAASQHSSPKQRMNNGTTNFTNFDQIVPPAKEEPEAPNDGPRRPPLTLHNANVTLLDDSTNDNSRIRNKPTWDYLVQIEPASSHYAGWMIVRRYSDFETLHEILRRIAQISGATAFTEQHTALPSWKVHTRESLRGELERYIRDACWYQTLAESEGMKRFLEKDSGHGRGDSKAGLGWESVSKNMVDVLTLGSKGAVEGGKAVFGGVTGVFNNIGLGPRRQTASSLSDIQTHSRQMSAGMPPRMDSSSNLSGIISPNGPRKPRDSLDSQRSSVVSLQPGKMAPMERRPSYDSRGEPETDSLKPSMERWDSANRSRDHSRASSLAALRSPLRSPSTLSLEGAKFPASTEDAHVSTESLARGETSTKSPERGMSRENSTTNIASPSTQQFEGRPSVPGPSAPTPSKPLRQYSQLSEPETRVAVELVFAIINEMYTLSSAWNIRRTLLAAAKSFLLRPGNPSLLSIQKMMQESVIEGNTSDAGIAYHLRKLRENTMPTDEERATWPAEMTADEKEKLRVKARRMLIERGVPAALSGVMGQAATSDALGRIFDCLQIEEVSRGLMFGMILQGVKMITH